MICQVVDILDGMTKKFSSPYIMFYPTVSRDGMPFQLPNTADITPDGKPMELSALTRTGAESHSPDWDDIAWMRAHWDGPLVVKGVQHPDDARRALDAGADGVVVSNHGGRQVDGAAAALDALPGVVAAVGERTTVLFDSGVRTGADAVKALALGASAVLVGRPLMYGLGARGGDGVRHVLACLLADLDNTMGLAGIKSVGGIGPDTVRRVVYPGDVRASL